MRVSSDSFSEGLGDLARLVHHLPLQTKDATLIVLKGHLLLEELIRQFIDSKLKEPKYLDDQRLTFVQSVALARALGPWRPEEWVWQATLKVNSLRNGLAHSLEPKNIDARIEELVTQVKSHEPKLLEPSPGNDWTPLHAALIAIFIALSAGLRFRPKGLLG